MGLFAIKKGTNLSTNTEKTKLEISLIFEMSSAESDCGLITTNAVWRQPSFPLPVRRMAVRYQGFKYL